MINGKLLQIGKNASGDEVWICGHCVQPADEAHGAQNKDDLAYMLMCPARKVTLGEWEDLETRHAQLLAHKQRLSGPR